MKDYMKKMSNMIPHISHNKTNAITDQPLKYVAGLLFARFPWQADVLARIFVKINL